MWSNKMLLGILIMALVLGAGGYLRRTLGLRAPAGGAEPRKLVILTHFDPFGGASANASKAAAHAAAGLLKSEFEVRVLELPTIYDVATEKALEAVGRIEKEAGRATAAVVSVGEGGCDLRLETQAHNRDSTPGLADNGGTIRDRRKIEGDGPAQVAMPFPVKDTLASLELSDQEALLTRLSDDPGAFVCNNTAYRMARYFSNPEVEALYTFVHVPNHRCEQPDLNTDLSASVIAKLVRGALK